MLAPEDDYSSLDITKIWEIGREFTFPPPVFDESNPPKAIHIAVPDHIVPDEYWINQSLDEFLIHNPNSMPSTCHSIAQVGPNSSMGHSSRPNTTYS